MTLHSNQKKPCRTTIHQAAKANPEKYLALAFGISRVSQSEAVLECFAYCAVQTGTNRATAEADALVYRETGKTPDYVLQCCSSLLYTQS